MNTLIKQSFLFLLARAHRSRLAAFGSALLALAFGRQLMARTAADQQGRRETRVIDGEYRRIRD